MELESVSVCLCLPVDAFRRLISEALVEVGSPSGKCILDYVFLSDHKMWISEASLPPSLPPFLTPSLSPSFLSLSIYT